MRLTVYLSCKERGLMDGFEFNLKRHQKQGVSEWISELIYYYGTSGVLKKTTKKKNKKKDNEEKL